ncbi:MAG: sulfotransferase [Candidatus Acidoferrales bacterium]
MERREWPGKRILQKLVPFQWRAVGARFLLYEIPFHFWRYTAGRKARLERPIFMIGCPRSGTTLSAKLFSFHPDVASWSEAGEIWDPRHHRNPEADHYWTAAEVTPRDAARLHARFEYHRRFWRKERFFNKNPRSSVRLDYIRAIFSDAVFLHVVRDGRAVVASMQEFGRRGRRRSVAFPFVRPAGWRELIRDDKVEQQALQWRAIVSYILDKRRELGSRYHEIRYEDLCEEPRRVLGAAYRFAGLRADEATLARLPEQLSSQNYKWKSQFSAEQIEKINRIQESLLQALGYPL